MITALSEGKPLPIDVKGQIIYYVGPSPARPGRVVGSAGPTTAMRLDPFTPALLDQGLKVAAGAGVGAQENLLLLHHLPEVCEGLRQELRGWRCRGLEPDNRQS